MRSSGRRVSAVYGQGVDDGDARPVDGEEPASLQCRGDEEDEDDEAENAQLQPDVQPRIVRLEIGHAFAHGQRLERLDPGRPVADPSPAEDRPLGGERRDRVPDVEPARQVFAFAEKLEELAGEHPHCADGDHDGAEHGQVDGEPAIRSDTAHPECEKQHDHGEDGRDDHRSGAGEHEGQAGDCQPGYAPSAANDPVCELDAEDHESEEGHHREQVAVALDALDLAAVEEEPTNPVEGVGYFATAVVGPERKHRMAHEGGDDEFEQEREPQNPAEGVRECAQELRPLEAQGKKEGGGGRAPLQPYPEGARARVIRPGDRQRRQQQEQRERHRKSTPEQWRPDAHQEHDRTDHQSGSDDAPAPPAEQIAPEVAGEQREDEKGRERADSDRFTRSAHGARLLDQTNAALPVMLRPTMSVFISRVPS